MGSAKPALLSLCFSGSGSRIYQFLKQTECLRDCRPSCGDFIGASASWSHPKLAEHKLIGREDFANYRKVLL